MRNRTIPVFIVFFYALLAFSSCSSKQVINVAENGDILCSVDIRLTKMFADYINDLSEAAGSGVPKSYFDTERIREAFTTLDGVTLEKISNSSRPELKLSFTVKNNAGTLKEASSGAGGIFRFSEKEGVKTISFLLDRKNYKKVSGAFAFDDNPVLAGLTPQVDNPYTEEEYLELVDYVFAEYSPDAGKMVKESSVDVEINVKGKILRADGGKYSGSKAVFNVPVLKFLTLEKPVMLEIEYR